MCLHSTVLSRSHDKGVLHTGQANPGAVQSETFDANASSVLLFIIYLFIASTSDFGFLYERI